MFFENHDLVPGNPVKLGDGCATVTGYELPQPLATSREGGSKDKPGVRISARSCSSVLWCPCGVRRIAVAPAGLPRLTSPSKRRMRPAIRAGRGWARWMPSFSDLPGGSSLVWPFSPPASSLLVLVSQP